MTKIPITELPDETLEDKLRSDAYIDNKIKEIYICIETNEGKVDNYFTSINDAKEFLETYE